jgi:hypothetical protein
MDLAALITVLTQLGLAAAAWRLANTLKGRVEDHEVRITKLEAA